MDESEVQGGSETSSGVPSLSGDGPRIVPRRSNLGRGLLITAGALGFLAFVVIYSMNSPKAPTVGKSKMTSAEMREAANDVRRMVRDVKNSDPDRVDTSTPARSELGKKLQEMARESEIRNSQLEKDLEGIDFEEILSAKAIGTEEGRRQAGLDVDKYASVMAAFHTDVTARMDGYRKWSVEQFGTESEDVRKQMANFRAAIKGHREFVEAVRALLTHAEKGNGRHEPKSDIVVFKSVEDTKTYHKLYLQVVAVHTRMTELDEAMAKDRQGLADGMMDRE